MQTMLFTHSGLPDHFAQRDDLLSHSDACEHIVFKWGFIIQRRVQQYVILDYCFDTFHQVINSPSSIDALHTDIYRRLEDNKRIFHRSLHGLLSGTYPWLLLTSDIGAFSLVTHIQYEQQACHWVNHQLIARLVPDVLRRYQDQSGG